MTQQQIPTKAQLLERLRSSGSEALEKLRSLPEAKFQEGRYENGWNARQILAHIASIEWAYPRLLDVAKAVQSGENAPAPAAPSTPQQAAAQSAAGTPEIMDYNERQVAKRADASIQDLLEEFQRNRQQTIAAIEAADESLFSVPVRSAGGVTGPLAQVFDFVAVMHVRQHVQDIIGS